MAILKLRVSSSYRSALLTLVEVGFNRYRAADGHDDFGFGHTEYHVLEVAGGALDDSLAACEKDLRDEKQHQKQVSRKQ